jgi:hypothetical protein
MKGASAMLCCFVRMLWSGWVAGVVEAHDVCLNRVSS